MSDQSKKPSPFNSASEQQSSGSPSSEPMNPDGTRAYDVPPDELSGTPLRPLGRQTLFVTHSASSVSQVCPNCQHVNRPGVLACERCGTVLAKNEDSSVSTKRFSEEQSELGGQTSEAEAVSDSVRQAMSTAGSSEFHDNMMLRLEVDGAPTPIVLSPKGETTVGRRDPATGTMPDVDMTAYAGYRLGVSRTHAIIRLRDRQLEIYDLGSSNGTAVNGVRLVPHKPHLLRDGDEITLGKMSIRVLFQLRNRRR